MRALSWLFSLLLHVVVVFLLTASVRYVAPEGPRPLINVELADAPVEAPTEQAEAPPPAVPEKISPQAKPQQMPLDKTIVLSREPVAPAGPVETAPVPGPAAAQTRAVPAGKPISSSVSEFAPELKEYEGAMAVGTSERRGAEAQLGMELYSAFYSYSPEEFAGQFLVEGDRVVTIIDARNSSYGRLLIYDSVRGELRRLRKFSKYIYTIGPSLYEDEPVTGSVTFLAKDDRIERFIYMPEGEKALFPKKLHFREEKMRLDLPDGPVDAILTLPPQKGTYAGAVLLHGTECLDPSLVQGAVRAFGMRDTAVLAFSPPSCGGKKDRGALIRQAAQVLQEMRGHEEVRAARVGLLGVGPGVAAAVETAGVPGAKSAFLMAVLGGSGPPALKAVARLRCPSLWILPDDKRLSRFAQGLEQLRDGQGRPITLVIDREYTAVSGDTAKQLAGTVTSGHAAIASTWLSRLK
ncbi:hypothetical protein [Salidesulfovibrio onnuriiensis]|uniref:hypothetical protein n=1 Tax=Salidesulfovibrio onnuriiensis TaxID=2583823 RepID=UPI0011C7384C|nr:hypothetical protein [Salidesulfovibrio onnuriiensis]